MGFTMKLADALREESIVIGSTAADKHAILKEIAKTAKKCRVLASVPEETVFKALENREALGTTGFGKHIAIPHCALEGVDEFVVGVIVHKDGVDFNSLDGQKVNVFVFIVGPKEQRNEHIHLLSKISRVLNNPDAVREILAGESALAVQETFLRFTVDEVDTKAGPEKSLFHVIVQAEDYFEDILQVFSEIDDCYASIIRADDTAHYLNRLPLFSGFFTDTMKGFNRIIIAVVPRTMTNESIRRINDIVGDIKMETGVLVLVQDVFYCSGSLSL